MLPLVAVSSAECVDALCLAGFAIESSTDEAGATLTKGPRVVVVPDAPFLSADDLTAILRSAELTYSEFLDLLSDSPTDPAISRLRLSPTVVHR